MKKKSAEKGKRKLRYSDNDEGGNMEETIPFEKCPKCGSKNLVKFDELRDEREAKE